MSSPFWPLHMITRTQLSSYSPHKAIANLYNDEWYGRVGSGVINEWEGISLDGP